MPFNFRAFLSSILERDILLFFLQTIILR